jgi:hypothetical protein
MTLRRLPGALILGLLASIAAHAAVSGDHAMGGAYHDLVVSTAFVAAASLVLVAGTLTWIHAGRLADGSILARALERLLPGLLPLIATTAGSYWMIESIEPVHRWTFAPLVAIAVVVAAWFVRSLTFALVRAIADFVVAIRRQSFAPRIPMWARPCAVPVVIQASPLLRRRFARPPPRPVA